MIFLRYNKVALAFSVFIISLCGFPGDKMPTLEFMDLLSFDKMAHFFCFGLLCFFTVTGLAKYLHFSYLRRYALRWAVAYCLLLAATTEIAQALLAIHRTGDWLDFLADGIGVTLGAVIYVVVYNKKKSLV